jgi:NTE family protein
MVRVAPDIYITLFSLCLCMSAALASEKVILNDMEALDRPTVGLVLSGGGARGAAHVGVIKVLDELKIPVDFVAGTSMGAIIGGLYASGMPAGELTSLAETLDWQKLLTDRPPRAERSFRRKSDDDGFLVDFDLGVNKSGLIFPEGFIQGQNFELALKRLSLPVILIDNFDKLPIPFRAVATDIVSGEAVVIDSGDLASAMRASMSAPGIFKPVRRNGRILVDGGIADNLPIQVVRDMGADILIVVDVGFPLLPEEQLGSAIAVTKQMLTILINSRAQEQISSLTSDDILISPDLGEFGSQDFKRLPEAQQLGEDKARELSSLLANLSVSDKEYLAHRERIDLNRNNMPTIDAVVVANESRLSPKVIESRLNDQTGKPLDPDQLESNIADIYGFNTFETVSYSVANDTVGNTLFVRATEKSWGPNYLRFGINLEDNFNGNSSYNVAARLTRTEINPLGGELRAELQIGETPRLSAELFQPLDYKSRWFVNPKIEFARVGAGIFDNSGFQIAKTGADTKTLSLEGGRQFGNWGVFRAGITSTQSDSELRIGLPGATDRSSQATFLSVAFEIDTIDRLSVPRSGTNFGLEWIGARESLGSDITADVVNMALIRPKTWGKNTLMHWWDFTTTTKDSTIGSSPASLGGLFSLSGYAPNELNGKHGGIGRVLYYRALGDQAIPGFNTSIYLGASFEMGNVWQSTGDISFSDTKIAGSLFVVFDTFFGPIYLAYGAAEGGRQSAYLYLGQTF